MKTAAQAWKEHGVDDDMPMPEHFEYGFAAGVEAAPAPAPQALTDADRLDAERWAFFRTASSDVTLRLHNVRPDYRDSEIDAARAASAGGEG
jgi:hypothetical protein